MERLSRRCFCVGSGAAALAAGCSDRRDPAPSGPPPAPTAVPPASSSVAKNKAPDLGPVKLAMAGPMPRRPLGKTGVDVSLLCLGGYHLGTLASAADAVRLVHEAMEHGLNFFDCAWEYHEGKSEEWLGQALAGRRDKAFVMTKVCTHGRDAATAMTMLEDSLRRLRTDHLDLWQVHEVVYANDPERHHAAGGVVEALARAREQGKVRFVGFTGHKSPEIHLDMLARAFPWDAVQMPLNAFDGSGFRSFERQVLPALAERRIGALGMKAMGGEGEPIKKGVLTAAEALHYAMSLPIASLVTGIDSSAVLRQNLNLAGGFEPLAKDELDRIRAKAAAHAADGRYELFKTTAKHDGDVGRAQHGFPLHDELGG